MCLIPCLRLLSAIYSRCALTDGLILCAKNALRAFFAHNIKPSVSAQREYMMGLGSNTFIEENSSVSDSLIGVLDELAQKTLLAYKNRVAALHRLTDELDHLLSLGPHQCDPGA